MSDEPILDLAPEASPPEKPSQAGFWKKLNKGLLMTHTEVLERLDAAMSGKAIFDEETLEYLEETLIATDLGVETTMELIDNVRRRAKGFEGREVVRLREMLADEMAVLLLDAVQPAPRGSMPLVSLLVGVNGVGKTTSVAKLARWSQNRGEKVLLAAADTFRAAAVEQVTLWGERLRVDVVKQGAGADPAAVVFDALKAAEARAVDHVIVDTAGRLHNKDHLMAELAKIQRIIDREAAGWERRTLLVLDATMGQNAVAQAREFTRVVDVDGVLLAKLDGTAKGGVVVAVARDLRLPVVFLGVGESADDLVEFRPREFAAALLG
ncbi:MAG: signal recognition particle-docking protein FtsY [Thermoanaerobaculia bacterium]